MVTTTLCINYDQQAANKGMVSCFSARWCRIQHVMPSAVEHLDPHIRLHSVHDLPSILQSETRIQPTLARIGIHQQQEKTFSFFLFRPYSLHTLSFSFCFPYYFTCIRLPNLISVNFLKCLLLSVTSVADLFPSMPMTSN